MAEAPRSVCYECWKPSSTCICTGIVRVENRTPIFVLQHPRERLHPVGTVRLARLGLARVEVEVVWNAGERDDTPPAWLPPGAGVLYPSADAVDLASLPESDRPTALIVLDGTWHTARTLHRDKAWLAALPHYRLSPQEPSRYRIRKEPDGASVSTLEAIVEALRVLEPDTPGLGGLIAAFDGMIDRQLEFMQRREGALRSKVRRPRSYRGTPRALVEHFDRVVVTYVESARPEPHAPRELVQCVAVGLSTGRRFEAMIQASFGVPSAVHLAHMNLSPSDFEEAVPEAEFAARWEEFLAGCGPDPIVAAWNQGTLDLIGEAARTEPSRAALKNAYRTMRGGGSGGLEDALAAEGAVAAAREAFRGRAGVRVGSAITLARHLNQLATGAGVR